MLGLSRTLHRFFRIAAPEAASNPARAAERSGLRAARRGAEAAARNPARNPAQLPLRGRGLRPRNPEGARRDRVCGAFGGPSDPLLYYAENAYAALGVSCGFASEIRPDPALTSNMARRLPRAEPVMDAAESRAPCEILRTPGGA